MKGVCLVISPRNASGSREKKNGVGMALDVATLPLILYRKVYTHALSMYYIARTSYTFLPCFFNLPFLLHFFISNVFSTCSCPFFTTYVSKYRYTTVNDITPLSMYYIARTSYTFLYLVSLLEPFLLHFSISMFQVKIDFLLLL